MYKLYHHPICPFSRKIRFFLKAKKINFTLNKIEFWRKNSHLLSLNPNGEVPILYDEKSLLPIYPSNLIIEYIDHNHKSINYSGISANEKIKIKKMQYWFDCKFYNDVSKIILQERYFNKFILKPSPPKVENIVTAKHNLDIHIKYIESMLAKETYILSDKITIADFTLAGHISSLDYFGDIDWDKYDILKNWYYLIKSNKSFNHILEDKIHSIKAPAHYRLLDF